MELKKIISFVGILLMVLACEKSKEVDVEKDEIETAEVSGITQTSATLSGYAFPPSGFTGISFGFIYADNSNPSAETGTVIECKEIEKDGKFVATITGLKPEIEYHYKAFLKTGEYYRVGSVKSFITSGFSASITTLDAAQVRLFGAVLSCSLEVDSQDELDAEVRFLYSEGNVDIDALKREATSIESQQRDGKNYSVTIAGLESGTEYSYVAFAKVYGKEVYGTVKHFKTEDYNASVTTGESSSVGLFSATVSGNLVVDSNEYLEKTVWFLYSAGMKDISSLQDAGIKVNAYPDDSGAFSASLESLNNGTEYSFVACAKVHDRTVYGDVCSFSTLDYIPIVTTQDADGIALFNATLNGLLTVENDEQLNKEVGFFYGKSQDLVSDGEKIRVNLSDDGSFSLTLEELDSNTKYYYQAYAKVKDKEVFGEISSFTSFNMGTVNLGVKVTRSNGTTYTVKWAECNVGASVPEEYGDYYAWGEIETKDYYTWEYYKWCKGNKSTLTKYCPSNKSDYWGGIDKPDNKKVLELNDDIAYLEKGEHWRIPTNAEIQALIEQCEWIRTTQNGVAGYEFRSKDSQNTNRMFLPASGEIYADSQGTSSLIEEGNTASIVSAEIVVDYPWYFYSFWFTPYENGRGYGTRSSGYTIRPVYVE